jgi:serralysin
MLDDVNYVIEVEKSGKTILDLSHNAIDRNVTVGSDEYAGIKSFSRVITGAGDDVITVNTAENIQIKTGPGNDTVHGGDGNDQIRGGKGKDNLFGGNGDDFIIGGKGKDTIAGGLGNDTLKGGGGKDIFVVGQGHDTVLDFDSGKDTIRIDGIDGLNINDLVSELEITSQGVKLNFSDSDSLHLIGISAEELYVDDFVLVE